MPVLLKRFLFGKKPSKDLINLLALTASTFGGNGQDVNLKALRYSLLFLCIFFGYHCPMSQSRRRHSWNEVIGVVLVGGGLLLLLALLSFEPRDVPPWLFYAKYSSASPIPLNFVGRVGAIIAGLLFFLLGGASFFAAAALLGLGIAKFLGEEGYFGIRFGWSFVFVLSWSFFSRSDGSVAIGFHSLEKNLGSS